VLEGAERARQPALSVPRLAGIAAIAMGSGALGSGLCAAPRPPADPLGEGLALAPATWLGPALRIPRDRCGRRRRRGLPGPWAGRLRPPAGPSQNLNLDVPGALHIPAPISMAPPKSVGR